MKMMMTLNNKMATFLYTELLNKLKYSTIRKFSTLLTQNYNYLNYNDIDIINRKKIFTIVDFTSNSRRKEYIKKEIVGFTMEQMYEVVSDVSNYYKFVPYVKKSITHSYNGNKYKADLIVGFPPLKEIYTSTVTQIKPNFISSECNDGKLFNYLLNEWKFKPGVKDIQQTCVIDFKVTFEFKSLLHRHIANLFFDLICDQMENAFKNEAKKRFGNPTIKSHVLFSHKT